MTPVSDLDSVDRAALAGALLAGVLLQVGLSIAGHFSAPVADLFTAGRSGIAALTGLAYGRRAGVTSRGRAGGGGAVAGGAAALTALIASYLLGDIPGGAVAMGAVGASAVAALGGWLGHALGRKE